MFIKSTYFINYAFSSISPNKLTKIINSDVTSTFYGPIKFLTIGLYIINLIIISNFVLVVL